MEFIVKKLGEEKDGSQTVTIGRTVEKKLKTGQTAVRKMSYCTKFKPDPKRKVGGKENIDLTEYEIVKSEWTDDKGKKAVTYWLLIIED